MWIGGKKMNTQSPQNCWKMGFSFFIITNNLFNLISENLRRKVNAIMDRTEDAANDVIGIFVVLRFDGE